MPEGAGDGVQANITITGEPPVATFDRSKAHEIFYHDVALELAQQVTERLEPQPLAIFAASVALDGAELPPAEYIICTQDRAIPPALQQRMATRTPATVHELDSSHSPLYSMPERVQELLEGATQRAMANQQ